MRIVVVGAGMAAARLAQLLPGRDVTLVGAEPVAPYNRVLLTDVLGGRSRAGLTLRVPGRVRTSARAVHVDRASRAVELADGERVPYDHLVLATGARPVPVPGALPLRTLADLARIEATRGAVTVLGGGPLGLQAARALALRGRPVGLVETGPHPLPRHLGAAAGATLARTLRRLGVHDGPHPDAQVVLAATGAVPDTALAAAAGLAVGRGVVVDDTLTTSDPAISAIGDCAEHRGTVHGTVAPAWEQAAVLAERLAGGAATYAGSRPALRLRAPGLAVAVLGDPEREPGERVEVANPVGGSHRRLVVRDGVVVAAALVGDLARVGLITQHVDHRTRLGRDEPGELLVPRAVAAPPADRLPDDAEVCACAGVSAARIRACASYDDARATTRATTGCGGCAAVVRQLVSKTPQGANA